MLDSKEYYIKNRENILAYKRKHYLENKDRILKYKKKYYSESNYYGSNKEEILKKVKEYQKEHPGYCKLWYEKNKTEKKEYGKQYRKDNPEKMREKNNKWSKNKWKTDLKYNLNRKMKNAIYSSLRNNKNGRHWEDLVGYNLKDLINRLKRTIPKGYTWQDYLEGRLHIDHIIPISAFNYNRLEHPDFKKCWALKNLRLLPAEENLIKGCKLENPFQPTLKLSLVS